MTPVWYAAEVNSPTRWLAWLLLCLLAFAAPAQAMNGLRLPMSAFSPGPKTACTAKPSTGDFPINKVDPSGLDPFGYSGAGVDDGIYANGAGNAEVAMGGPGVKRAGVTFAVGTGYRSSDGRWHGVNSPNTQKVNGDSQLLEAVSSKDFVLGLESTTDVFVYVGHHFGGGKIKLSDGDFDLRTLIDRAQSLPKNIVFAACNTGALLASGLGLEKNGSTFVGVNDFINMLPSTDFAVYAGNNLGANGSLSKFLTGLSGIPNLPGLTVAGAPIPYKFGFTTR